MLNSKEFLKSTTDDQIRNLIAGGVPGTEMPRVEPRVRWDADRRADPPDHDLPPFARSDRAQRPDWRQGSG